MSLALLTLNRLSKSFENGVKALNDVSLKIQRGEFCSILGPSGCGKSTLLRLIAGLENPSSGSITFDDQNQKPKIGFVFQEPHLLPWRSLFENIAIPLEIDRTPPEVLRDRVQSILSVVGLSDFAGSYPHQLSGGMKMRASVARALVDEPELLLLDEPFAALDEFTRQKLDEDLRDLWTRKKMTVLFVTHSISEAAFLSNRAIVLSKRPASVLADYQIQLSAPRTASLKLTEIFLKEVKNLTEAMNEK